MVQPVSVFIAFDLGKSCLIGGQVGGWGLLKLLMHGLDANLAFASVTVLNFLFPNNLACAFVPDSLRLQVLALEVKETERIFFPRLSRHP